MLKKLSDLEINAETPFKHDALFRQEPIEILTKLIESTSEPFVLSVEAPWGFGKTTFIKLWKAYLESRKHVCLYFNAWESDFVDDPLIAFLGEMKKFVEEKFKGLDATQPIKADWEDVKRIGGGVLRKTLPLAIQIATHGFLDQAALKTVSEGFASNADKISEFASELAKERLEKYAAEKEGIIAFRKSLEKLALEISRDAETKPPLVFFVDELDRCRPDFAVTLLERIKHLFNVKNVVFVLAIDRGQLNQSVKALYGVESKPDGYLRRFIDFAYQLPEPPPESFALNLYSRFLLGNDHLSFRQEAFLGSFSDYARAFCLSLRAQEQCFMEMNIALRVNPTIRNFPYVIAFLATLRVFRPGVIEELRANRLDIESVLEWISGTKDEHCKIQAEAALRVEFSSIKNTKRVQEFRRLVAAGPFPQGQEENIKRVQKILQAMDEMNLWHPNAVSAILSLLTLSVRFG